MQKIREPWIKLKETINDDDYNRISCLQDLCAGQDGIALKLELDYKRNVSQCSTNPGIRDSNEFMFFDGETLIGYLGICQFAGGETFEVNGMVHPDYRRQGVFTKLFYLVKEEWKRRNGGTMYLLCDRKAEPGLSFIKKTGASFRHAEYEMFLRQEAEYSNNEDLKRIVFRKALNLDAMEIARQNHIYFNDELPEENMVDNSGTSENLILPEEEEKKGISIYLVEIEEKVIGKVHLQLISGTGGIYGLGILPEYRGKGYGRALLLKAVEILKEQKAAQIMLQVAAENETALRLYKSGGFKETSTMHYYGLDADAQ